MRVGLNGTCFNDRPSGATQRFRGIYGALVKRRPDIEFVVYEPADCRVADWFNGAPNVSARRTPMLSRGGTRRWLVGKTYWPGAFRRDRLDLFEHFNIPLVKAPTCPTLYTIHDIRSQSMAYTMWRQRTYRRFLRGALRGADRVISVSDTMRGDIQRFCPEARITRVYNGLDVDDFSNDVSAADRATLAEQFGIHGEFLLAVGHMEPRKNYPALIDAMAQLRDRRRPRQLVIVGNDAGQRAELEQRIADAGLGEWVRMFVSIATDDLRRFYRGCTAVVFPSAYEGFGIPILEAMATHRPAILSELPVFREITEDRGAYFPLHDPSAIADVIDRVLGSPEEMARLVAYGDTRLDSFRFDKLAAEIEAIHAELLGSGRAAAHASA